MKSNLFLFLFICQLFGCSEKRVQHQIKPAFYFWKSNLKLTQTERNYLADADRLYVKFFDVDLVKNKPISKAEIRFSEVPKTEIIPTVFITNKTLVGISKAQTDELSSRISLKIKDICTRNQIKPTEIQLDCDWSASTQRPYFYLLQAIKKQFPGLTLSCTIRLHQVKFVAKTGVPPVDRGMLMCYNMGDWQKTSTRNSILDPKILDQYAGGIPSYPLPLDLAMPIFKWAILYRNEKFIGFFNNLSSETLRKKSFVKEEKSSIFRVQTDTLALGVSLRQDDIFRTEAVDYEILVQTTRQVLNRIKNPDLSLSFYHLDSLTINEFTHEKLKKIYAQTP